MFAYLQFVGGNGVPHPFGEVFLFHFHCVFVAVQKAGVVREREVALVFLCVVQAEGGTDIESFQGVQVDVCVTEDTPVGIAVVAVVVDYTRYVLAVGHGAVGAAPVSSVYRAHGNHRKGNHCVAHYITWGLHFGGTVEGEVFTDGQEITYYFIIAVDTGGDAVEVGVLYQTVVLIIS